MSFQVTGHSGVKTTSGDPDINMNNNQREILRRLVLKPRIRVSGHIQSLFKSSQTRGNANFTSVTRTQGANKMSAKHQKIRKVGLELEAAEIFAHF